jgi:hypothetical protein
VHDFECRSDEDADPLGDVQRMVVPRRIGKATERGTITAGQAMRDRRRRRVVPMRDVRNRVQREGKQQSCERNSQPLRRSSGQLESAHNLRSSEH